MIYVSMYGLRSLNLFIIIRGNWQIARSDLNNPRIIAMVSTDRSLLEPDYDEYAVSTSRSILCCRSVAVIVSLSLSLSRCILLFPAPRSMFQLEMCLIEKSCWRSKDIKQNGGSFFIAGARFCFQLRA